MISLSRKGRKRKSGYRHPSGGLVNPERQEDPRKVVMFQPHRRWAKTDEAKMDSRCATPFGILAMRKIITSEQFEAGNLLARDTRRFHLAVDAPPPHAQSPGFDVGAGRSYSATEPQPEDAARWRRLFNEAMNALGSAESPAESIRGRDAMLAVSRMAVYGEELPAGLNYRHLIVGLNGLVAYYGLTGTRKSGNFRNT